MISVLIYIFFFGEWFINNKRKYGLNSSTLLIGTYLASALALLFLIVKEYNNIYSFEKMDIIATLYHIIILWLFMRPIIDQGNLLDIDKLKIPKKQNTFISWTFVIIGLLTIILSIPGIISVLSFDTFEGARQEAIEGDEQKGFYSYGLIGYIATIGMITPMFAIFMAFYRLFCLRKADILFYLLILTSLSGAIMNLTIAGRDGIVRWIMFVVFNIALFKKQFSIKLIPKFLLIIFTIIVAFTLVFFALITFSRFGDGNDAIMSIIDYLGMSFFWFSDVFRGVGTDYLFGFNSIFPIIPGGMNSLDIAKLDLDFSTMTFHTFAGSFVLYVGTIFTAIMAVVFYLLYKLNHSVIRNRINNYFAYMIFYQIEYIGVFYFVYALLAWQCSFVIIYLLSRRFYLINKR